MRYLNAKILTGCLMAVLMIWAPGLAVEPQTLLPIDPVPLVEISDYLPRAHWASPERYGFIDRIHDHCFVISDICRGFARDAIFRTGPGGPATSRNAFREGDYVGFRFNLDREVEEVWFEPVPAGLR